MNKELYGLTPANMMRTLPGMLAMDEGMNLLAQMVADGVVKLAESSSLVQIYARIDELDERVLDILAVDLRADWYDFNYSLETKRAMIRDSFYVHRKKGTKGSIAKALSDIFPNSTVQEWFEYGGDPYCFRVVIDVTDAREQALIGLIKKAIEYYKSFRSHIEEDNIIVRISCGIAVATGASGIGYTTPRAGTVPAVSTRGGIDDSAFTAGVSASGSQYRVPMCGTAQNALM